MGEELRALLERAESAVRAVEAAIATEGCRDAVVAVRLRELEDRVHGMCTAVLARFAAGGAVPARFVSAARARALAPPARAA